MAKCEYCKHERNEEDLEQVEMSSKHFSKTVKACSTPCPECDKDKACAGLFKRESPPIFHRSPGDLV